VTASRSPRWRTYAVLAAGAACAVASVAGLRAGPARAAGLFSYDLTAGARGWSMSYDDPTGMRYGEGTVPEASANVSTGPIGRGLATIAWPGPVLGNAGSLILVLRPDAPKDVTALNDPVRAESRIGDDPPQKTYDGVPGATMATSATPDKVSADSAVKSATGDESTFGPTTTHADTVLAEASATSNASSRIEKVALAGGVIKIESVTSTARAVSDGVKAEGDAVTHVEGLTIGGVAATIDQDGLHFGDSSAPANAVANQIAKQALEKSGAELVLSSPIKEIDGATATVNAGSLLITWTTPGGTFAVVLGGARAAATAGPSVDDVAGDVTGAVGDATGTGDRGGVTDSGLGDTGAVGVDAPATGDDSPAPSPSTTGARRPEATLRTQPIAAVSRPVTAGWVALGVLAAGLLGFGMKRLSDDVLAERAATCPLEGDR
jgi:hypothetical protein